MRHAIIMAGGAGTRLWPLSRKQRPKQLMRLFGGKSLLQLARDRLRNVFDVQNTWIITNAGYIELVSKALPDLPAENLIGEPVGRDTSNAIGLAAHLIEQRDADATMAVFTADHIITPQDRFDAAVERGLDAAEAHADSLVTFGIRPTEPHTGYGYVHRGERIGEGVYRVREFKEKPSREVAERYVASGEYAWNSGMFVWRVAAILGELARNLPENDAELAAMAKVWRDPAQRDAIAERFGKLDKISIDFGVMEQAASVLNVEMACEWLDLGSWNAIAATRAPDDLGNVCIAENAIVMDGRNNVLVAEDDHLLVALGVRNLAIIRSEDATLIVHRDAAQRIKELGAMRRERFGERYE